MKHAFLTLACVGLLRLLAVPSDAQVNPAPTLLNYQGRLATPGGNPVPDGTYSIRFSLWDVASGGTAATNEKWTQTIASVQVKNGTFAVLLNTATANLFNENLWLETKIGSDTALAPRQQLVSVAYAMKANSVPDGSIGTTQIADASVTSAKLANSALNKFWRLDGNMSTVGSYIGTNDNSPLVFRTNFIERMRLDGTGNILFGVAAQPKVGIGTGTPGFPLTFAPDLGDKISLYGLSGDHFGFGIQSGQLQIHTSAASEDIVFGYGRSAAFNETMRIKGNGNVGLGTFAPSAKLDVRGSSGVQIFAGNRTPFGNAAIETDFTVPTTHAWFAENGTRVFSVTDGGQGYFGGNVGIGTAAPAEKLDVTGNAKISGEVTANVVTVLGGSDVAEPYNVTAVDGVKPIAGMLVTIDPDKIGQMRVASRAYDNAVAGIISGANGVNPGITLRQKGTIADGELPVASIGRVWCWCDAYANGSIKAGDLLTSSDTPGHAMKATDREKRDGAVIGKAMSSLKSGKGLVLVLVSLK